MLTYFSVSFEERSISFRRLWRLAARPEPFASRPHMRLAMHSTQGNRRMRQEGDRPACSQKNTSLSNFGQNS
jgi:hypothetical protein